MFLVLQTSNSLKNTVMTPVQKAGDNSPKTCTQVLFWDWYIP